MRSWRDLLCAELLDEFTLDFSSALHETNLSVNGSFFT